MKFRIILLFIFGLLAMCCLSQARIIIRHKRQVDSEGSMPVETVIVADGRKPDSNTNEKSDLTATDSSNSSEKTSTEKPITESVELDINPAEGTVVFGSRIPLFVNFGDFDRSMDDIFSVMRQRFAEFYRQMNLNRDLHRRRFGLFPMNGDEFGDGSMMVHGFGDSSAETITSDDKVDEKTDVIEVNGVKYRVRNKKIHKKLPNGEMVVQTTVYEPLKDAEEDSSSTEKVEKTDSEQLEKEEKRLTGPGMDKKVEPELESKLSKIVDQKPNLVTSEEIDLAGKNSTKKEKDDDEDD